MSEYDELYADEFFIIDSNKLNEVESEFYGYLIDEGNFYTRDNFNNTVNLSGLGAYINIDREYNEIIIKQDANGSFGLYAYKNEDVFCISNSFVKLLDYVKQRYDDAKDPTEKARFADINTVLSDKALCDTIARTHLFDKAMFSSELSGDGVLEYPNMMDRFINYYSDSIKVQAYDGIL